MKKQLLTIILICSTTFCFSQKHGSYRAVLTKVEVQDKTTADSSAIRVDSLTSEPGNNRYIYSDTTISIIWTYAYTQFGFDLKNMSNETIKLVWDDASYINTDGSAGKVFHAGVKYIDRNNSQPATTIIKQSKLSDLVSPTDNVYYRSGTYGGWSQVPLFPTSRKLETPIHANKTVRILLPIIYQNNTKEYVFTFRVKWIEDVKNKKS